jgi:Amino acid permease
VARPGRDQVISGNTDMIPHNRDVPGDFRPAHLRGDSHFRRQWQQQTAIAAPCTPWVGTRRSEQLRMPLKRGYGMGVAQEVSRGLPRDVVGPARTIAFGTSIVAPSASAVTVLVLVLAYAGFASPLVILITFAGSLCCALSIGEFAGRLPSAGWAYTYNSRGLGPAAGFLTGWMMIFGYVLFVPAGVALTSTFGSLLVASTLHVTVSPWIFVPRRPRGGGAHCLSGRQHLVRR